MPKNYTFEIRETLTAIVHVTGAPDRDAAESLVRDQYSDEKIVLDSASFSGDIEFAQIGDLPEEEANFKIKYE